MISRDNTWETEVAELLARLVSPTGATVERRPLTELLTAFRVVPKPDDAAQITVYAAPDQLIVEAGRGARFELEPLPGSSEEVAVILDSVVRGGLCEEVGRLGIKFSLTLQSGETRAGRVLRRIRGERGLVRYGPY